ncbi:DUF2339 domain-containing protein [Alkalisalibacterium limincola]|uniref:DUF2339 domain-containing protein n=1 Tax=Alkalisalibacterium limincola TaxID=2699169 RepID=A0A5C8KW76_9GAMM|nr:DUF2339 domain-containing protein [Alkalisalibacterium limincola]TXK64339.1 DUF2339 domain-containing protein [Alkalisalibacterium limincola]
MESIVVILVLAVVSVPVLLLVVLVQLGSLRGRTRALELELRSLRAANPASRPEPAAPRAQPATVRPVAAEGVSPRTSETPAPPAASPSAAYTPATPEGPAPAAAPRGPEAAPTPRQRPSGPSQPGMFDTATRFVRRWFTEGNVPVKIGMLVLFAGVAALLKYASDQGWMTLPLELRLAGIALAATAGLAWGWQQRERRRSFALSLQGGSIGILLMTVFAAFRVFGLIPSGAAFAISLVLVAGTGVLAVRQDARALAVLAILAGFLTPVLVSTGEGSHVALFSYYALLNLGILAIAWLRPWRALNLMGFAFTFGIGVAWGVLAYRPEHLPSTLPFLVLFFALYLVIPLLYARRRGALRRDLVDGCLVFGNPLVSFALLAGLLDGQRMPLAFAALGLALLYVGLAWTLFRRQRYTPLAESWAVLGAGFATLAVPLALSARATASVFALEGAALVWLGLRQGRRLPLWSGVALQMLAALALLVGFSATMNEAPWLNPGFIGALLLSAAGLASAWSCRQAERDTAALWFYLWGLAWWTFAGATEIDRFAAAPHHATLWLAWLALGLGLLGLALRRSTFGPLPWTAVALLAGVVLATLGQMELLPHPFHGHAAWAWMAHLALGVFALAALRDAPAPAVRWALGLWLLGWALAVSLGLTHAASLLAPGSGWQPAAFALPWMAVLAGVLFAPGWIGVPLRHRVALWQPQLASVVLGIAGIVWLSLLTHPGGSQPLPHVPLLNPVELASAGLVGLLAAWLWSGLAPPALHERRSAILPAVLFITLSMMTLRGVHHFAGIPWSEAMLRTAVAQSSLTLLWSVLGVAAWILGSRRGQRAVWLAGAVLMGVVLVKLVLVDRQHLGNLAGIASFIGYGLLCTAVGYFAPAPPRPPTSPTATAPEAS